MTRRKSPKEYVISRLDQLRVLTSPPAAEVVDALQALREATAKELAQHLGRLPESLYYHLRRLRKVGLVVEAGQRSTARRPEVVYGLPGQELSVDATKNSRAWLAMTAKVASRRLRAVERELVLGLELGEASRRGPTRALTMRHHRVRLTQRGLRRANVLLDELTALLDEERKSEHGAVYSITTVIAPAARGDAT